MSRMITVGLVVQLEAKPEMAEELAEFLRNARELAAKETGMPVWLGLRTSPTTFWIVDAFFADADRKAHFGGEITKALGANSKRLLAAAPVVMPAEVLASKVSP